MNENEQLLFDFGDSAPADPPKQDEQSLVFETEEEALHTLIDKEDPEWVPCDESEESDAIAIQYLNGDHPFIPQGKEAVEEAVSFAESISVPDPDAKSGLRDLSSPAAKSKKMNPYSLQNMCLAALGFLAERNPSALAGKVPTNLPRVHADAASVTLEPNLKTSVKIRSTALVRVALDAEKCKPDFQHRQAMADQMDQLIAKKLELEAIIRETEPGLCKLPLFGDDTSEQEWDYSSSRNPAYRKLIRSIRKLKDTIQNDDLFARIETAQLANELYLAVPKGLVTPEEIPPTWGLVFINESLSAELGKPAIPQIIPEQNQVALALRIAAGTAAQTLFAAGIQIPQTEGGKAKFHATPKRRRTLKF